MASPYACALAFLLFRIVKRHRLNGKKRRFGSRNGLNFLCRFAAFACRVCGKINNGGNENGLSSFSIPL